jgi:hypothetical protein
MLFAQDHRSGARHEQPVSQLPRISVAAADRLHGAVAVIEQGACRNRAFATDSNGLRGVQLCVREWPDRDGMRRQVAGNRTLDAGAVKQSAWSSGLQKFRPSSITQFVSNRHRAESGVRSNDKSWLPGGHRATTWLSLTASCVGGLFHPSGSSESAARSGRRTYRSPRDRCPAGTREWPRAFRCRSCHQSDQDRSLC